MISGVGGLLFPPAFALSSHPVPVKKVAKDVSRWLDRNIALTKAKPTDDVVCFDSDVGMACNTFFHVLFSVPCVGSALRAFFCFWLFTGYHCTAVLAFVIVFHGMARCYPDAIFAHHVVDAVFSDFSSSLTSTHHAIWPMPSGY